MHHDEPIAQKTSEWIIDLGIRNNREARVHSIKTKSDPLKWFTGYYATHSTNIINEHPLHEPPCKI